MLLLLSLALATEPPTPTLRDLQLRQCRGVWDLMETYQLEPRASERERTIIRSIRSDILERLADTEAAMQSRFHIGYDRPTASRCWELFPNG